MGSRNVGRDVAVYILSLFKEFYPFAIAGLLIALALLLRLPDIVLIVAAGILAVGMLVYFRYTESKRLKMRSYESMSPELRQEIDEERRINKRKQRLFLEAMEKAGGKEGKHD